MSSNVALSSIAALSLVLGANVALAQNAVTHSPPSERTSQSGIVDPNVRKNQGGIVDPNFKPTQGQIIDPNNRGVSIPTSIPARRARSGWALSSTTARTP